MRASPAHACLLTHAGAELCCAALPSERAFLQHVRLRRYQPARAGGADPLGAPSAPWTWRLALQAGGCWAVEAITPGGGADDE